MSKVPIFENKWVGPRKYFNQYMGFNRHLKFMNHVVTYCSVKLAMWYLDNFVKVTSWT